MAISTAEARRSIAGFRGRAGHPGVTPNIDHDAEWRFQVGRNYSELAPVTGVYIVSPPGALTTYIDGVPTAGITYLDGVPNAGETYVAGVAGSGLTYIVDPPDADDDYIVGA